MYYISLYNNLCSSRSQLKEHWGKGSGLHRHHIKPRHMGGIDDDQNFTYLTLREHIIAHFLLWKIYKNPNDLRSMHMLGAELSVEQRRAVGIFCRNNKLGFHGCSADDRAEWRTRGLRTQKKSGDTNSWYFWSTEEGRKKRASMGGKIGGKKQAELGLGFHNPEVRKKACSLGGKSHVGKVWVNKQGSNKRVSKENLQSFLDEGWTRGFTKIS